MKVFICFALFIAAASASGLISPLGLGGIGPLGVGLAPSPLLVNGPLVSSVGLASPLVSSPLGLGGVGLGGLALGGVGLGGLGVSRVIGGGIPLNAGLGLGLGLGGVPLGGKLISPLNSGLLLKK